MSRYVVYGGSFDPIHEGHLSMIERAIALGYDVIVVPAYRHAFGKKSAPFEPRVRMCELALQERRLHAHARLCRIECALAEDGDRPIYTYEVLCALRERLQVAPRLLVGPDIAAEWTRWYRHEAIDREFGRLCLPMTRAIRSTDIREQLQAGIPPDTLREVVPASVLAYIQAHELYR